MKRKYFIYALILVLIIPFIGFGKTEKITTTSNNYLDPNATCPGVSNCCESGFNVMCQMVDPLKNYAVTDTVCRDRGGVYHWGVDLVRTSGNGEIYAALEGRVIAVTNSNKQCPIDENLVCSPITCPSSRGNSITIEVTSYPFQGYQMHYMHLSSMDVKVGDIVTQGQKIGIIGTTGCSTGEHLHFQINNLAGDPININGYFEDKGSYICGGGGNLAATNKPIYQDYDFTGLFTTSSGNYRATLGNCVGNLNGLFNQGTELIIDDRVTVNVQAVESGFYIKNSTALCTNGVTIRTDKGEYHTYCNMDTLSNMYNVGSYIQKGTTLGSITSYGSKSLLFSINRYGKYVDLSTDFLMTYGGKCSNSDRDNCRKITNTIEYNQCINIVE